jgi:hypothetical protein
MTARADARDNVAHRRRVLHKRRARRFETKDAYNHVEQCACVQGARCVVDDLGESLTRVVNTKILSAEKLPKHTYRLLVHITMPYATNACARLSFNNRHIIRTSLVDGDGSYDSVPVER